MLIQPPTKFHNTAYDLNGNIKTLSRNGMTDAANNVPSFGQIDKLAYTYTGNQLTALRDLTGNENGFKDGVSLSTEYVYDANGNMIEDKNKGITVTYNHMNLPTSVTFDNGNRLEWTYDAAGIKINKKVIPASATASTKDYTGGIEYAGDEIESIQHAEGRLVSNTFFVDHRQEFIYEYTLKDHLGNSRVMFSDRDHDYLKFQKSKIKFQIYYNFLKFGFWNLEF